MKPPTDVIDLADPDVCNGWKELAAVFGLSVRAMQDRAAGEHVTCPRCDHTFISAAVQMPLYEWDDGKPFGYRSELLRWLRNRVVRLSFARELRRLRAERCAPSVEIKSPRDSACDSKQVQKGPSKSR